MLILVNTFHITLIKCIHAIVIFNILSIHDKIMCPNLATKLLCPKASQVVEKQGVSGDWVVVSRQRMSKRGD